MKKLFALLLMTAACLSAAAQESKLLEDWSHKMDLRDDSFVSPFGFMSVYYNHDMGAYNVQGLGQHGVGLEISTLYIGFHTWQGGRLNLGLLDFCADWHNAQKNYGFSQNLAGDAISPIPSPGVNGTCTSFAFLFPLALTQDLGKWSLAVMAGPGVGFDHFENKYIINGIRYKDQLYFDKGAYFRLNLSAHIWYKHVGLGIRYSFPKGFNGAGMISAGISFAI